MGTIMNTIATNRRNRVQTVARNNSVSYINLPQSLSGYEAMITLKSAIDQVAELYYFKKLGIIQLKLTNTGNKDYESFDFGINLKAGADIIGFETESQERYHPIKWTPEVSVANRHSELDFLLKPFNCNSHPLIHPYIRRTDLFGSNIFKP